MAGGASAEEPIRAQITFIPAQNTIAPGETITIGVRQDIAPRWHTYWLNPGDSGEPMRLRWTMPPGFVAGDITWPVPERIFTGPLASYGYHDTALMLVPLTAPEALPPGPVTIAIRATTLVCEDICIPETTQHELILNDPDNATKADADIVRTATAHFPQDIDIEAFYSEDDGTFILRDGGVLAAGGVLAPFGWGLIDNTADAVRHTDGTLRQVRGDRPLRGVGDADFLWLAGDGTAVKFTARADETALTVAPASNPSNTIDELPPATIPGLDNLWLALLFAFLGGVILNLMPCVFPVLFMKALSLCQIRDSEEREVRVQALLYTAGILVSFMAVAGLLLALRAGGAQLGWGFQLQSPGVVAVLALLFMLIGLNLSGFFEISGRLAGAGEGLLARGGKHGHAFFMGVLATIVATPCTAPFMAGALGFAMTQGAAVALGVFAALGLGLAAPYVALSFIPPLRRALPRPGTWMETFRRVLAVPIFLTVLWLGWVYVNQTGAAVTLGALLLLALAAATVWRAGFGPRLRWALSILFIGGALWLATAGAGTHTPAHTERAAVVAYDETVLADMLAGDGAVFVNMTADWCITCKVNERVALRGFDFAAAGVTYMEGDWTRQDENITKYLARYGRNGVPLYVFYGARDRATGNRPEPVVLPQILTPGIVAGIVR